MKYNHITLDVIFLLVKMENETNPGNGLITMASNSFLLCPLA